MQFYSQNFDPLILQLHFAREFHCFLSVFFFSFPFCRISNKVCLRFAETYLTLRFLSSRRTSFSRRACKRGRYETGSQASERSVRGEKNWNSYADASSDENISRTNFNSYLLDPFARGKSQFSPPNRRLFITVRIKMRDIVYPFLANCTKSFKLFAHLILVRVRWISVVSRKIRARSAVELARVVLRKAREYITPTTPQGTWSWPTSIAFFRKKRDGIHVRC